MHSQRALLVWFGLVLSLFTLSGQMVFATGLTLPESATTATNASSPASQRVVAVNAGYMHTCALTADGKVWCWGANDYGQLGDGTTQSSSVPVQATLLGANAVMIVSMMSETCALTTDNRIVCWGDRSASQIRVRELGGFTGRLTSLSTSSNLCAVTDSGQVICWYSNSSTAPHTHITSGAVSVSGGFGHTCAVMADGRVLCWGFNQLGQLGDGTTENRYVPTAVVNLPNNIIAVATGWFHTCALSRDGRVWCWGYNSHGQLGDGTIQHRTVPVAVADLPAGITGIAAGSYHTCAHTASGSVWCWGNNFHGSLGNNEINTYRTKPVAVTGITSGIVALTAGLEHTCALTVGGGVLCWGRDLEGQLGNGRLLRSDVARYSVPLSGGAQAITAGGAHTCALAADGRVMCWGIEYDKNLCDSMALFRGFPTVVKNLSGVAALDAGAGHTCALTSAGSVICWGENHYGQAGNTTFAHRSDPVQVSSLSVGVRAIAAGGRHSCALKQNGEVVCWGRGWGATPTAISGMPRDTRAIDAGYEHSCALAADGSVRCWGSNSSGQLGNGTFTSSNEAPVVVNGLSGARAIATGGEHTCAITATGGVACWGKNEKGQLGDGTTTNRATPVAVHSLAEGVVALAAGFDYTCALTVNNQVKCWGAGFSNRSSAASIDSTGTPVTIDGLNGQVVAIAAGNGHSCALLANGSTACWGSNYAGQLGLGDYPSRGVPVLAQLGLSQLYVPLVNR